MDEQLKSKLESVCSLYTNTLNDILRSQGQPDNFGVCYLTGHCISEGLSKRGLNTKETTGVLFLKNKTDKFLIYGPDKYEKQGILVGNYHTWCVMEYEGEEIIIDPSIRSMKSYLREHGKIKVHEKVPDLLITDQKVTFYYKYITDEKLIDQSKFFLEKINQDLINQLIQIVYENSEGIEIP